MNNFTESYEQILKTLKEIETEMNFLNQIRVPKLSDIELIAVALTAEYLSIDSTTARSEHQLFRKLPTCLLERIERSVYNRRKRRLFAFIESLRSKMADLLVPAEEYFIVDSMPLEVCRLSRERKAKVCRESYETAPDRGFRALQKMHFFGYKLHAICSLAGVFKSFELTKASVHDIHYLKNVKGSYSDCTIMGGKGYLSAEYQLDMFQNNIRLQTPMRKNQAGFKPQSYVFKKSGKQIETLFSQCNS